jgi:hypothetical protein
MAAYTGRSRSTEASVIPTCVSVTMANRRLIARHATWPTVTGRDRVVLLGQPLLGRDRVVFH